MNGLWQPRLTRANCFAASADQGRFGRRNDREGRLACRQDPRQEIGDAETRASRPPQIVRAVLPCRRWRAGTDSVLAWACIRANDGALFGLQTAISSGRKRSNRHRTRTVKTERAGSFSARFSYRITDYLS